MEISFLIIVFIVWIISLIIILPLFLYDPKQAIQFIVISSTMCGLLATMITILYFFEREQEKIPTRIIYTVSVYFDSVTQLVNLQMLNA